MIFDMIGVRGECQHGDAIPVSQQIAECDVQWYQWELFQFKLYKFVAYSGDLSEIPRSIGQNWIT